MEKLEWIEAIWSVISDSVSRKDSFGNTSRTVCFAHFFRSFLWSWLPRQFALFSKFFKLNSGTVWIKNLIKLLEILLFFLFFVVYLAAKKEMRIFFLFIDSTCLTHCFTKSCSKLFYLSFSKIVVRTGERRGQRQIFLTLNYMQKMFEV